MNALSEIFFGVLGLNRTPGRIPSNYYLPVPAAVTDDAFAYALSMSGLFIICLTSLEWIWRMMWRMVEKPEPFSSPRTLFRLILILICASALLRNIPNVILTMAWKEVDPATRYCIAHWDRVLDGWSAVPQVLAWSIGIMAAAALEHQLGRPPIPSQYYPNLRMALRPAAMILISVALCFAIAFVE